MTWVGRYHSPEPIRCRGALHFYSARELDSDRLRVVVMAPRVAVDEARERLKNLARVQHAVAGGAIPDVVDAALDEPVPWVALDCDGVADLEHITDFVRHGGDKPDFEQASCVGKTIMESLIQTHAASVCLGSLATANLLFGADGKMWIVGFGAGPLSGATIAPEVASGSPPTPGADVYALLLFLRAQIEFVRTPPIIARVFAGDSLLDNAELMVMLAWSNLKILAGSPSQRPDMQAALAQARKLWHLLGFEPDAAGFAAFVARAIAAEPERLDDAPVSGVAGIVVGGGGEWLETPNGMRHNLRARRPLRRLLFALADTRRRRAGAALTVDELLQAGWPGETPLPEAGQNRVYVAISTLRKLGLGDLLQRWDGGYRIDPNVRCDFKDL
jgi:hypothetical protein